MTVFSKYTEENIKMIQTLDPRVQDVFLEFLWRIAMSGIYVRITSAARDEIQQGLLYAQGRWLPGKIVTSVQGKDSMHVWGLAIDIVPLRRTSILGYVTDYGWKPIGDGNGEEWVVLGRIAADLGITWGYEVWGEDAPHFMWTKGISSSKPTKDLKNGRNVQKPSFSRARKDKKTLAVYKRFLKRGILL